MCEFPPLPAGDVSCVSLDCCFESFLETEKLSELKARLFQVFFLARRKLSRSCTPISHARHRLSRASLSKGQLGTIENQHLELEAIASSNKGIAIGTRTLLVAPGLTTSSDAHHLVHTLVHMVCGSHGLHFLHFVGDRRRSYRQRGAEKSISLHIGVQHVT